VVTKAFYSYRHCARSKAISLFPLSFLKSSKEFHASFGYFDQNLQ
jgi:hypothetical protein